MYTAKICLNSVSGGPINFILGGLTLGRPPPYKWGTRWLPWQQWFPSNRATKSAFYDRIRIYQKRKGL